VPLSLAAFAFVFAGGFIILALGTLSPAARDFFLREHLLMGLLTPQSLTVLLLAFGYGVYFILSTRFSPCAKLAASAVMLSFLLLLQAGMAEAVPAAYGLSGAATENTGYAGLSRAVR
jgi:hypothetical protein